MHSVVAEFSSRVAATRAFLREVDVLEKAGTASTSVREAKGFVFVQNYAVYEYVLKSAVKKMIGDLNTRSLPFLNLRTELLSLALDGSFTSVREGALKKTWASRIELVQLSKSTTTNVSVPDTLFPKDGSHYRKTQLELLWEIFGLPPPILPHPRFGSHIEEMVNKRNLIAHGEESPSTIGRGFTIADLDKRISDTELLCAHILTATSALLSHARRFE